MLLWTHFCFRELWENEKFARQVEDALHFVTD